MRKKQVKVDKKKRECSGADGQKQVTMKKDI